MSSILRRVRRIIREKKALISRRRKRKEQSARFREGLSSIHQGMPLIITDLNPYIASSFNSIYRRVGDLRMEAIMARVPLRQSGDRKGEARIESELKRKINRLILSHSSHLAARLAARHLKLPSPLYKEVTRLSYQRFPLDFLEKTEILFRNNHKQKQFVEFRAIFSLYLNQVRGYGQDRFGIQSQQ